MENNISAFDNYSISMENNISFFNNYSVSVYEQLWKKTQEKNSNQKYQKIITDPNYEKFISELSSWWAEKESFTNFEFSADKNRVFIQVGLKNESYQTDDLPKEFTSKILSLTIPIVYTITGEFIPFNGNENK